ncbi:protein YidR [Salmonella bongori]|nr:protein YidR [Salmonella bongori]
MLIFTARDEYGWKQVGDTNRWREPNHPAVAGRWAWYRRRLTFTHHRAYIRGLLNVPRHWVRGNPQATAIAFLMRDDNGVAQLWADVATGRRARQLTHHTSGVRSAFNWHPSGKWLGMVLENRIACCDAQSGKIDF